MIEGIGATVLVLAQKPKGHPSRKGAVFGFLIAIVFGYGQ